MLDGDADVFELRMIWQRPGGSEWSGVVAAAAAGRGRSESQLRLTRPHARSTTAMVPRGRASSRVGGLRP